jgi:5'-deoxynucleotidase YfbR-like HD superfamily hydrolase
MKIFIFLAVFPLLFLSCRQNKGPEDSLRDYIRYAVSGNVTQQGFLERSAGELLVQLEMMDPDEFNDYAKEMAHVDSNRVRINSSNCQEDRCSITYTVSYKSKADGKDIYTVEVRKNAELLRVDSSWKLASINNIKSHYEGTDITEQDFRNANDGLSPEEVEQLRR